MKRKAAVGLFMLGIVALAACGGGSSSSSDTPAPEAANDGPRTYAGTISYSFVRDGGSAREASGSCSLSGPISVTIDTDGDVVATTGDTTDEISAVCQYVDEILSLTWSGTATDGSYSMNAAASGPHASVEATVSGTYDDSSITGSGSGSVTVTVDERSFTLGVDYSFTLTAV